MNRRHMGHQVDTPYLLGHRQVVESKSTNFAVSWELYLYCHAKLRDFWTRSQWSSEEHNATGERKQFHHHKQRSQCAPLLPNIGTGIGCGRVRCGFRLRVASGNCGGLPLFTPHCLRDRRVLGSASGAAAATIINNSSTDTAASTGCS